MEDTAVNHPSLPTNYVSINDLRDKWLNQQQQQPPPPPQQQQQQKLPKKYVTILDLRERWLKQQQEEEEEEQKQETEKEKEKEKEKEEVSPHFEKPHQLTKSINPNCSVGGKDGEFVRKGGHNFRNSRKFKPGNPNLDVKLEKNKPGFRNPIKVKLINPNFVGETNGYSEKNKLQLRNPNVRTKLVNPNLIEDAVKEEVREIKGGFCRNPNRNNRGTFQGGFHGEKKFATEDGSVKRDKVISQESEIDGKGETNEEFDSRISDDDKGMIISGWSGNMRKKAWKGRQNIRKENVGVEGEVMNVAENGGQGELKDAQTIREEKKKLMRKMKFKRFRKRNEAMNRKAQNVACENQQSVNGDKSEEGKSDEGVEESNDEIVAEVNHITGIVVTEKGNMWKIKGYTNTGYKKKVTEKHLAIPGSDMENEVKKSVEKSNGEKTGEVNHRRGRVVAKEKEKIGKSREYTGRGYNYNYNNYKKFEGRRNRELIIEKNEDEGKEKKSDLGVENSNGDTEEQNMLKMNCEVKNVEENDCGGQLKDVQTIKETPRKTENTVCENREPVIEKNVEKVEKGNDEEGKEVKDEGVADVNQNMWKHRGYTNRRYTYKKVTEKYLPITGSDIKEDEEKKSDEGVENSNEENKSDEGVENSNEENKSDDEGVENLSGETVAVVVTEKQKMWKSRGSTGKEYNYENGSRDEGGRVGGGRCGKGRGRGDWKPEYSRGGRGRGRGGGMVNGSHRGEGKKATGSMWVKKA